MKTKKRSKFRKTSAKTQKNWIYKNFQQSLDYLPKIKKHFVFSLILFLVITALGFFFPIFFEKEILKLIEELIKLTAGMNTLELISFIIFNNLKSALFAMILGIFFGIIPIGVIIINAYVLGFVANKTVLAKGTFVLWRLFPHGIFEIPAVLISTALGMKLGFFLFSRHEKNKTKEFWKWIKDVLRVFLLVVIPLLVIAGIIEGLLIGLLE